MSYLNFKAVAGGAVLAVIVGTLVGFLVPTPNGEPTDPGTVISALSGLLAYLPAGYLAGRIAASHGGINGLATAVAGFLLNLVLGIFLFAAGLAPGAGDLDPDSINAGGVAAAGLLSLALSFVGAYAGGKLGERGGAPRHVGREAGRQQPRKWA